MAKRASDRLFFSLFLSLLIGCSSGTLVGFSYHAGENTRALDGTISFLKQNNITPSQIRVFVTEHKLLTTLSNNGGASVDLCLNQSQLENLIKSKSSAVSWLKTHVISLLPRVNIKTIIATVGNNHRTRQSKLPTLLSTLKSIHSALSSFRVENQVMVSVMFPLSFFNNLNGTAHDRDLRRIFSYVKEVRSSVIVEATMGEEEELINLSDDGFVQSVIQKANSATSILPGNDVPMVLTIKSPAINPSSKEVAEFTVKVSKALENDTQIKGKVIGLYAEIPSSTEDFTERELKREEQIFPSSHRELLTKFHSKTTSHDTIFPATPTIVTVPSSNPVTITPANPADTPVVPFPLTTPVTVPSTFPANTPAPITVPGAQPITNPVTTYPAPSGTVPTTTPVTANPIPPPAPTFNVPAAPGQSWCVAKSGAPETALQAALDYACGAGADCSQIQQGGSCYNPNTLQNHASYAFNSYYLKNPAPTSCDFGGTAAIVNANPSTGSCIYPTSSSSSTSVSPSSTPPSTPTPSTPTPITPTPTTPTVEAPTTGTATPSWGAVSGSGSTPPSVLNTSTGTTPDFGLESPPGFNSSTSKAVGLRPFIGCIFLVISFVTRKIVLGI